MAWNCCGLCKHEFDEPTLGDCVLGYQECPECFHHSNIDDFHRKYFFDELEEKLKIKG